MSGAMPYRPEDFGIEENFDRHHFETEKKLSRSWPFLLADFAVTTTVHGLRYLVEPTRYVGRKLIWILLIAMSIVLFVYLVVMKLVLLFQYQTSVSLDIRYNDTVVFPAVTICNQCPYKLTAIQDLGLYDLMVNDDSDGKYPINSTTCDEFFLHLGICQLPDEFLSSDIHIGQVTRTVCLRFCLDVHDAECSAFVFNRTDNSCTLTAYTGEWLPPYAPDNCSANSNTDSVEFYRRKRCPSKSEFYCNFENASLCSLTNGPRVNETWSLATSSTTSTIPFDNTLNRPSGHFQLMMTTDQRLGYIARLLSPYLNTTDRCIELYFWMDSSVDIPVLSVISVSEEGQEDTVTRTYGAQMPGWIRMFSRLRNGINRIVIEGKRGTVGFSGIAVDDISVQKCTNFDAEVGCRVNPFGTGYFGSKSEDESGNRCLMWLDYGAEYGARLPDVSIRDSQNFCRNVLGSTAWAQPSCIVDQADGEALSPQLMPCNISFCGCRPGTSFVCANGMCLPRGDLVCNGEPDCSDGSDESSCSAKTKVSCDFEDGFRCGYVTTTLDALSWRLWKASGAMGLTQAPNMDASGSLQGSYMLVSSVFGEVGDRVRLMSPLLNLTNATSLQFSYYLGASSSSDSITQLALYQMSILLVRTQYLFVVNQGQGQGQRWVRAEVCLPSGAYYLGFVATVGLPFVSDIALDDIHLSDRPGCPEQRKPPERNTIESVSASVNCSFSSNFCGYTYVATSNNFELSRKPNTRIESYPRGVQLLCDSQGSIVSPDPCSLNGSISSSLIWAPNGSMVTLSFTAFDLAEDITCSRERLKISYYNESVKDWNVKAILCGNNRPQKMMIITSWTKLDYHPFCDRTSRASGFNVSYRTSYPAGTELTLVMKLNAQTYGDKVTSYSYEHLVKLFSPVFELKQNSPACLVVTFVAFSRFIISLAYSKDGAYRERQLHRNIEGFQLWSSFYYLQRNVPAMSSDGQKFVLIFFAKSKAAGDVAHINDIILLEGSCPVQTEPWSGSCDFYSSNTCGFLDESESGLSWVLVRNEGLRCEFDGLSRSGPSVLRSPPFLVDLRYDCFRLAANLSSDSIHLDFTFVDTSGESFASSPQITDVYDLGRYYLLPIAEHLNNSQVSLLIKAYLTYPTYEYTYGYLCNLNLATCPKTDPSTNRQDKVSCCEGFASSGYQYGQKWIFDSNNSSNHYLQWGIDSWNEDSSLDVDDAVMTPVFVVTASVMLRFDVHFPASDQLILEVRTTSQLGLIQRTMAEFRGNDSLATTVKGEVCLPVGEFRLVFLVDGHNYTPNRTGGSDFVRITGYEETNSRCTVEENANDTECSGESLCLDRVIVSDSTILAKSYFAGKPITINGDVLGLVRFDLVGSVLLTQSKETVVYLLSPSSEFSADIDATNNGQNGCWGDPENSNVTVSTYEAGILTKTAMTLSTFASGGNYQTENGILVIYLPLRAVNCLQYLNYSITPTTTQDYFVTVTNRTNVDGISADQIVSQWNSEEYILVNDSLTEVCVVLDFELSSSGVGVFLFERGKTGGSISSRKVFGSGSSKTAKRIYARIQVELQNETSRIQLQVNFTKDTVIRQVKILENSCTEGDLTDGSCSFQQLNGCGYRDASKEETHWALASEMADDSDEYSRNVDCSTYADGRKYTGKLNKTISGRTCQRWDVTKPHYNVYNDIAYFPDYMANYPNAELENVENFCRNPVFEASDLQAAPWCYTTDPETEMDYCLVPNCQNYFVEAMFCLAMDSAVLQSPILQLNNNGSGSSSGATYRLQFDYRLSHPKISLRVLTKTSEADDWRPMDQNLTFEMQKNSSGWSPACFDLRGPIQRIAFVAEKIGFTQNLESAAIASVNITKDVRCQSQGDSGRGPGQQRNVIYNGTKLDRLSYMAIVIEEKNKFNMDELQIKMGHKKNDMIFKCTWGGIACDDSDVILEQTDLSVCFTFNGNSSNRVLSASNTGSNDGLQLTLNIEQYENVPGMGINRGVKMHFRNQDDVPQVLNAGFMIPPGYQTLAQLEFSQSTSLEKPWGRCSSRTYRFFNASDAYTTAKCQLECKTSSLIEQCQCRDPYMAPGPAKICNFSRYLNCARRWVDNGDCNCPDDCDVHLFTTSLSSSQFSNEVVDDISKDKNIQDRFWNALEISNRVNDATFRVAVRSMMEVVERHQDLLALTLSTVVEPSTSTTALVLAAVKSLAEEAKRDIVDGGRAFLDRLKLCYDQNVCYVVQSVASQLQDCSERLARMLVILFDYPNVGDYYQFMSNAVNETQMLDVVLRNADRAFGEAASKSYCPDNCLDRRCVDAAADYDKINGYIGGNITFLVKYGTSYLMNGTAAAAAATTTSIRYSTTQAYVTNGSGLSSPTNSSTARTQSGGSLATTRPYQGGSTVGVQTFPPQLAATTTAAPPAASARVPNDLVNSGWFRKAVDVIRTSASNMNRLRDCVTGYPAFLKEFGDYLDAVDLAVSSIDTTVASSAVKTLSQDSATLRKLLDDYRGNRITKRRLASEFLADLGSSVTFHVDAAVSSIDSSVVTELSSIIASTEQKLVAAYGDLMDKLSLLQSSYLPIGSTVADYYARSLSIWKRPQPTLQDVKLTGYQLNAKEMYRTWPRATDLVAFTNGRAKDVLRKLLSSYDAVLKQTVGNVQTQLKAAQQVVSDSVTKFKDQLLTFNVSTAIDDNFAKTNIIKVDVFYGEMKYRTMQQSKGYDSIQFLSDFGGCFGLFLGGSLLSVFEFLDLLIYNVIVKARTRKIRPREIKVRPITPDFYA